MTWIEAQLKTSHELMQNAKCYDAVGNEVGRNGNHENELTWNAGWAQA